MTLYRFIGQESEWHIFILDYLQEMHFVKKKENKQTNTDSIMQQYVESCNVVIAFIWNIQIWQYLSFKLWPMFNLLAKGP